MQAFWAPDPSQCPTHLIGIPSCSPLIMDAGLSSGAAGPSSSGASQGGNPQQGPAGPRNLSGQPLTDAPKFSGSLVLRYETPISERLKVSFQGDVFHRSSVFTELGYDPFLVQRAYTKVNARIGLGQIGGGLTLEVFGRNLTDVITFGRGGRPVFGGVTALLPAGGAPSFPVGNAYIKFTGEPRTYGVTARYSF